MEPIVLHSARLRLRPWHDSDPASFAEMNGDPEVMRHFPACLSTAESDALAQRVRAHFAEHGFGAWVLERHDQPGLIGVLGLLRVGFEAPFTPAVEITYRLHKAFWRQGYVLEAAQAALAFAFERLQLDEVVAFTVPANLPSRSVMQRLGMRHDSAGDFEHPRLPVGHPLRPHVLYRLARQQWQERIDER